MQNNHKLSRKMAFHFHDFYFFFYFFSFIMLKKYQGLYALNINDFYTPKAICN